MGKKITTAKTQGKVVEPTAMAIVEVMDNNRMGRPTKYDPTIPEKMIKFFSVERCRKEIKKQGTRSTVHKNGTETNAEDIEFMYIPNDLPTIAGFAREIKVHRDTLDEWRKAVDDNGVLKYPEFSDAYNEAKILQAEFLMGNALQGLYPPSTFIFIAKNVTDMRDEVEIKDSRQTERLDQMQKDLYEFLNPGKPGKVK